MKLILDTHTFIWWATSADKLSSNVLALLNNADNQLILSLASVWEMQIKCQIGKLQLGKSVPTLVANQQENNHLLVLPIELSHVYALENLPGVHKDPFDRIIIAQAVVEKLPIITIDPLFDRYPVVRIW
jgi:PIN domain nuclease of toxin-antitoxin system